MLFKSEELLGATEGLTL